MIMQIPQNRFFEEKTSKSFELDAALKKTIKQRPPSLILYEWNLIFVPSIAKGGGISPESGDLSCHILSFT